MTEIDPLLQAKDADGVHDGDTVMRQYPSPVPNGQDTASFFDENGDSNNDTSIPNDAAPHPEQQLDQEHHQQQPGEQPSSNEHDGQTQPQDHQEHDPIQPPSARQTMTSAEELQLAAQLSQDISQSMPSALLEASSADVDVDDSSLRAEIQESNEPINLDIQQHQDNPLQEEHMQDHEHHLPPQEHDQPLPPQDQHLQHHDQAMHNHDHIHTTSNFFSTYNRMDLLATQCNITDHRSLTTHLHGNGPRYHVPATNAAKRGPSKGYIKELADRIHSIEGKLASEGGNVDTLSELLTGTRRESSDLFSPAQPDDGSRKRPYSSMSTGEFDTPESSRQTAWNSESRPIQPFQPPRQPYSANGLAPQPLGKPDEDTPSRPPAVMDNLSLDLDQNGTIRETVRELDDGAFTGYLNVVHQCYPLLAVNKARVEDRLLQCPSLLREAFVEALYGTMQSFVSVPGLYTNGDINSASRLITEWESDSSPRTPVMNLVHLQTLILTAIATDNYGPLSLKGEHGGASKASVLGRAVGLAYSMRLHMPRLETNSDTELDPESDENVATRAWWTLIMLDRWNAISTSSPLFIPNDSVVIVPSLSTLLGEGVYHLARLSNILGHFVPVSLAPPRTLSPASGVGPILSSFFNLSIELFREVLPSTIEPGTHPILHLVYWHSRLLAYLFQTNSKSRDILWPCKESVALLLDNGQVLSPLNHHFFCLTTLSLLELGKVEATREEANDLLKELLHSNHAPSTWDGVIRDRITEGLSPTSQQASTTEMTASQGLQHLADLATATKVESSKLDKETEASTLRTSDNYEDVGFDPRHLTRGGYLNILVESRPAVVQ
ncbi:putative c6 finger domain-containing protein [Eutypa lata UCREL1]|uniref:Putative c6 finger domain-containing protein n=1 Tax=Eutypa lata (strain UCR-EL1) TaxID=1287681 RepID=M7SHI2_EUTLA|nr:putative c6 finger domain-containing protein [Eutypa lata UCREL1]